MKRKSRLVVSILVLSLIMTFNNSLFGLFSVGTTKVSAMTITDLKERMGQAKLVYKDGDIWSNVYYANNGTPGPWECFGFACEIFRRLFQCEMPRAYIKDEEYHFKSLDNVVCLGTVTSPTTAKASALLSQARIGDVIQAKGSLPHTMIVNAADSNDISIYDANSDLKNTIRTDYVMSYKTFVSKYYVGFSLYRYSGVVTDGVPDITNPTISNVSVTGIDSNGYTVTCTVSDNVGVIRVAFPTWTSYNGQDDLIWKDGNINGNTASFRVNVSEHNYEGGSYITHVYAYDAAGNNVAYGVGANITIPNYNVRSGNYTIASADKYYMMNVYAGTDKDGTKLTSWQTDGSKEEIFRIYHTGNGLYYIFAVCSSNGNNRVVDVNRGSNNIIDINDKMDIWSRNDTPAQLFYIIPLGGNKYIFKLASMDNAVIGITSNSNGAQLSLQNYNGSNAQQWYICDLNAQVINPAP